MIIRSKAPLRLGLAGGGTDVSPYSDLYGGAILNATINLYAYANIQPRTDGKIIFTSIDKNEKVELNDFEEINFDGKFKEFTIQNLGDILEAILIESIEPRQNRRQGNSFTGLEYLQKESPEIKKKQQEQWLKELSEKL